LRWHTGIRPEDISALVRDLVLRHGGHGEAAVSNGGAGAWADAFPGALSQAAPMPPRMDAQVVCARCCLRAGRGRSARGCSLTPRAPAGLCQCAICGGRRAACVARRAMPNIPS